MRVTLIGNHERLLPRDDVEAAGLVAEPMRRDGVELMLPGVIQKVERQGDAKVLTVQYHGQTRCR